jgi:uncharacterized protein (DUF1697 family)
VPPVRMNRSHYVAFLRGINVGGHAAVKMADLKTAFERMGFQDVRTVLASGNVIFSAIAKDPNALAKEIEAGLNNTFALDIGVAVRDMDALEKLTSSEPFKGIRETPSTRFYVTFLSEPRPVAFSNLAPKGDFRILQATAGEVLSVLDLSRGNGTPTAMTILEKKFGKNITTRNWNTVLKVLL